MSIDLFPTDNMIRLSANADAWNESIQQHLANKLNATDLSSKIDQVVIKEIEKIKGFAVGYLLIQDLDIRIPFIVKGFHLLPMDVLIRDGKYHHLNARNWKLLTSKTWPFAGVGYVGQAQVSGMQKVAFEVLELDKDEVLANSEFLKFASELAETHPSLIVRMDRYFSESSMGQEKKASANTSFDHLEISEDKTQIVRYDFTTGKEEAFSIKTASERFGSNTVMSLLQNGVIRTGFDSMEKRASEFKPALEPQFKSPESESVCYPKTIAMYDGFAGYIRGNLYHCRPISSPFHRTAMIFMSTQSKSPFYDLINRGHSRKFVTVPDTEEVTDDLTRPSIKTQPHMAIGLLMNNEIYGPFNIISDVVHPQNKRVYSIIDSYSGQKFNLHFSPDVSEIAVTKKEIIVPDVSAKLIWLGSSVPGSEMEKDASVTIRLMMNANRSGFDLLDNGVSGLPAQTLKGLSKTRCITALMHCGLTEEESKQAIAKATERGSYEFSATPTATGDDTSQPASKEETEKLTKVANAISAVVQKHDLMKIAKDMFGEKSVDLVLGLKLITPENAKRYKLLIPRISDTIDGLSRLLCAARLSDESMIPVDKNRLSSVISGLDEIAYELTGF